MPFLVEIANGSMSSRDLFEAALQVRLQRSAQTGQLLAAAHFAGGFVAEDLVDRLPQAFGAVDHAQ